MIKKREKYRVVVKKIAQDRIDKKQCPSCGKPKHQWERRKDWRCCSTKCTTIYETEMVIAWGWGDLRLKVFKRDGHKCKKCGNIFQSHELIGDHIIPIALGGDEWDMDNIQTLCIPCDKIKTKEDQGKIAEVRAMDKKLSNGQTQLA